MLKMKIEPIALLLVLVMAPASSFAGEISEQIPLEDIKRIEFSAKRGDFSLSGWSQKHVDVTGKANDGFQYDIKGSTLKLLVNTAESASTQDRLHLQVPSDKEFIFVTEEGNFSINGIEASINGSTQSGNVEVSNVNSELSITTIDGYVRIQESSGDFNVTTVNGEIDIENSRGTADLKTVSGDQNISADLRFVTSSNLSGSSNLKLETVEKLKLNNVNGDSKVESAISKGASIQMQSLKGNLTLLVPGDTAAEFILEAHDGGQISNALRETDSDARAGSTKAESFILGDGSANVVMNTTQGDIVLASRKNSNSNSQQQEFDWASVDTSVLDFAYINPDYEVLGYEQFYIKPPEITFDPRWKTKFGDNTLYRETIARDYSEILVRAIAETFERETNLKFSEKRGENILVIIPKVQELYIDDPDIKGASDTFTRNAAGTAKLDLVIYSPRDQTVLSLILDKRSTARPGVSTSTRVRSKNALAFRRLFNDWMSDIVRVIEK